MLSAARIRSLGRRLRGDASGVAFTEFALALPVVLALGFGGLETAHYALAVQQISQIAMTAADNAGRVRVSIDETDVNDVLTGSKLVGQYINFPANGRIILSDLERSTSDTTSATAHLMITAVVPTYETLGSRRRVGARLRQRWVIDSWWTGPLRWRTVGRVDGSFRRVRG